MDIEGLKELPGLMSLHERGVDLFIEPAVEDYSRQSGTRYIANLIATEVSTRQWNVELHINPDARADELEFAAHDYLEPALERLVEHGTEVDGWQARSDGSYQKWLRLHDFGSAIDT